MQSALALDTNQGHGGSVSKYGKHAPGPAFLKRAGRGAERRIRTSVTRRVADLQSAAINHSAISACCKLSKQTPAREPEVQAFPEPELEIYHDKKGKSIIFFSSGQYSEKCYCCNRRNVKAINVARHINF